MVLTEKKELAQSWELMEVSTAGGGVREIAKLQVGRTQPYLIGHEQSRRKGQGGLGGKEVEVRCGPSRFSHYLGGRLCGNVRGGGGGVGGLGIAGEGLGRGLEGGLDWGAVGRPVFCLGGRM